MCRIDLACPEVGTDGIVEGRDVEEVKKERSFGLTPYQSQHLSPDALCLSRVAWDFKYRAQASPQPSETLLELFRPVQDFDL